MAHAILSPSSAHRWGNCPASANLESQCENTSSSFAREGTAAHELAAECLVEGIQKVSDCIGKSYVVEGETYVVTDEMADYVQEYVDYIRALGGTLFVEQQLDISTLTGEKDAKGTSDAVVILGDELVVADLKYGMGVKVDAQDNEQLMMYGTAALIEFGFLADFKQVRLIIVQPRMQHISEQVYTVDELSAFHGHIKIAANRALHYLNATELPDALFDPGDKQCRFCKAKATCKAAASKVLETVADDFVDETKDILPQIAHANPKSETDNQVLANRLAVVDFIEKWCEAVRQKVASELHAGNTVPGYKLVEGRKGARQWTDQESVENMLKSMKIKREHMYDTKLISPTTAEKLHKDGVIGERQWPKVLELIEQKAGKPAVVPEADKRPALANDVADDFESLV